MKVNISVFVATYNIINPFAADNTQYVVEEYNKINISLGLYVLPR